ncbi:hypothetical protein Lser_V15G45286 [Lactuca serriola]
MRVVNWVSSVIVLISLYLHHSSSTSFIPPDNYLIDCGSSKNITFLGQIYLPDSIQSSFSLKTEQDSYFIQSKSAVPLPIHQSARVFTAISTYIFNIRKQGRHWIRLYFYPIPDHNLTSSSFTVVTENFVLLNSYSFRSFTGSKFISKEYSINVTSNTLLLNFIPSNNSIAFINAIEVVSIPDELIPDQATKLSQSAPITGLSELAFETVYRLNMGGPKLTPQNDTLGRIWENDEQYLHVNSSAANVSINPSLVKYPENLTPEIAPNWVYATGQTLGDAKVANLNFNITWVLPVDPDFMYFVRVHFCDIVSTSLDTLVFNLYINSDNAFSDLDLSSFTGNLDVPVYKDFVTVSTDSNTLSVSVGPETDSEDPNAILNGLEVLKISNGAKSFDGVDPVANLVVSQANKKRKMVVVIVAVLGAALAVIFSGLCYCWVSGRGSKPVHTKPWLPHSITMTKMSTISIPSCNLGKTFSFQEIMDATNKFNEKLLLGVGGFGRVYKGTMEDGTLVAIKRGNPRSEQGLVEFRTEIDMLSKLRHRHLVSLIGHCDERSEMILVYEFMANGPLRSHLYGTDLPSLSWKQRLEICIGAARGLHYLHTGASQSVIHRDVKTTNILLDENFVAKVADFGLSKAGPAIDQTHVSTAVKGSFGYLDPEYFRRQQLTEKSDVYSFGVVLIEVLCARPALNPVLPRDQVNIAEWGLKWQKDGKLDQIMDDKLVGKVNSSSLKKYGETLEKCLEEYGVDRPSMGDVLWNLEYALQLEETSALVEVEDNSMNHIEGIMLNPLEGFDNSVSMIDGDEFRRANHGEDGSIGNVFSQIVHPRGR